MMRIRVTALTALMVAFGLTAVQAGEVIVKDVHICCPMCVRDINKAMTGIEGVTDVTADRSSKTVTFQAANDEAAQAGVKTLAETGFFGTATHGDAKIAFPETGAKQGEKSDKVTLTGVHNCCPQCVKALQEALGDVNGVENVQVDRGARDVILTGKGIDTAAAVDALNKAGFFGKVKKEG